MGDVQLPEQNEPSTAVTYSDLLEELHGRDSQLCSKDNEPSTAFSYIHQEPSTAFSYIHQNLTLGATEIKRLRDKASELVRCDRKLILILDIDETLVQSSQICRLKQHEQHLLSEARDPGNSNPRRDLCVLESMGMIVKLRPFTRTFLQEASSMFEMHLYTMGNREYAMAIADFLDPEGIYFKFKVISRDDSTNNKMKSLDVVLGDERLIVILDDRLHVWQSKYKDNLIISMRYIYFDSGQRSKNTETEVDGMLQNVLRVLERAYVMFYTLDRGDSNLSGRDIREVLKVIHKMTLEGCVLAFDEEYCQPEYRAAVCGKQWKMRDLAEVLGATCSREVDSRVTHVISSGVTSSIAQWAIENDKFSVTPFWVRHSYLLWKRLPENQYYTCRS